MFAVEFRGLTKRFGQTVANSDINFAVERGTIHGIIGENGAGKSTLMKLLYGMLRPDAGEILIHDRRCQFRSPADAIARGIGMVHQHFMLAGPISVLDNILLGAEPGTWWVVDRKTALRQLERLGNQYGLAADWRARVEELPVGVQQRVELLKLLYRRADILILDEPTAVLTPKETESLFRNLLALKSEGKTVLLVTHKLKEVLRFTDSVTVLRAGKVTGQFRTSCTSAEELAFCMIGRKLQLPAGVFRAHLHEEAALEVHNLSSTAKRTAAHSALHDISFRVRRGEIVGIAGVEGNGQRELLECLLNGRGGKTEFSGSVEIPAAQAANGGQGYEITAQQSLLEAVAVIPEDRQQQALLTRRPLFENFLLGAQRERRFSKLGFLRWKKIKQAAAAALVKFDVRPAQVHLLAGALSGGNQQKLVLARELQRQPALLVAAQPTRGVDIGAIEFIHQQMIAARDAGAGVLLVSSDLDEILALADRILVLFGGRIVAEYDRGCVTEQELGLRMGGG